MPRENGPEKVATDWEVTKRMIEGLTHPEKFAAQLSDVKEMEVFYLREAERILPTLTDEEAKRALEVEIAKHKK